MNDYSPGIVTLFMVFIGGGVLGTLFFVGLWWTVEKGLQSSQTGTWFLTSSVLRTAVAVLGIYFITYGQWSRLLVCLVGFIGARFLVVWLMPKIEARNKENNAPKS